MRTATSPEEAQQRLSAILCRLPHKYLLYETEDGLVELCAFIRQRDGSQRHPTVGCWSTYLEAKAFIAANALENVEDKTCLEHEWGLAYRCAAEAPKNTG